MRAEGLPARTEEHRLIPATHRGIEQANLCSAETVTVGSAFTAHLRPLLIPPYRKPLHQLLACVGVRVAVFNVEIREGLRYYDPVSDNAY